MLKELVKSEEKKVEYIELIYDLIFVYIIGRNNSLLHHVEGGFFGAATYLTYLMTTVIVLQIWYFTTVFLNRHGTKSPVEYIGLFINMYLLYYMAQGTAANWQEHYIRYNVAWALILLNFAVQYGIKLFRCRDRQSPQYRHLRFSLWLMLVQAAVVLGSIPLFRATGLALSPVAMGVGILLFLTVGRRVNRELPVDFPHLSERVMLYVVFTFGEMIIALAGYFEGGFEPQSIYYSLMGFLIVAGLFLNYGYYYDHIVDRERRTNGTGYMVLHIFLVVTLNNITAALEYMREAHISAVMKNVFLASSFVLYFVFLTLMLLFAKSYHKPTERFFVITASLTLLFAAGMGASWQNSYVSIAVTVAYIYAMFAANVILGRRASKLHKESML